MSSSLKTNLALGAIAAWLSVMTWQSCTGSAHGFSGVGGPLGASGGLRQVTQGSGLSGSGTSTNPLVVGAGSGITVGADDVSVNAGSGLTSDLTSVRANLGTGMAFSSGAIVPNLAGATCTNDQGVTSISSTGTGTCGNVGRNAYGGTHFEWADDFMTYGENVTALSNSGIGMWGINQSGTGVSASTNATGTTTRPGILELSTGTTNVGRSAILAPADSIDFGSGSWTWEGVLGWPALSDAGTPTDAYASVVGLSDTTGAVNVVDGCYFMYDSQNVATGGVNTGKLQKLECACANASARTIYLMDGTTVSDESFTTVNAPVAALTLPSTNIYHLKIAMTGTTRAEFFVNGVKSCDINTHIPSGAAREATATASIIKNTGTTARVVDIDFVRLAVDLNAVRSP